MKHIFIYNPAAGRSDNAIGHLKSNLKRYDGLITYEIYHTTEPGDATAYVRTRCKAEPEEMLRFYACGGDGTANEVLHGIIGQPNASMTIFPCGSGNDFVKYYGGAKRFLDIDALINGVETPIDVMRIGDRYSLNVTNFGFDTAVARTMEKVRRKKIIGGKNAYTTGILTALMKAMKNDCTVFVDGEQINDGKILLCTVANGSHVGGSFKCAPKSDNTDGLLEICLVRPVSRFTFIKLVNVYKEGTHLDDDRFEKIITYRRGKSVRVCAPEGFAYTLDGEIVEQNEFTIENCPAAIRFAVPAEKSTQNEAQEQAENEKEPATV
ncbi:MAG: YegS/Rv2252/BmrU family lipid kinase [Clostridia bacterium]|nr:YegS/Rv2252/BmrU family lipid kinase [Clostridia bacterium]